MKHFQKKTTRLFALALAIALAITATALAAKPAAEPTAEPAQEQRFLQSFTATDLDGNTVDESLFKDYDVNMINIWATFCSPCLSEMPDLGKLAEAYRDKGAQVIGLVSDGGNYDGTRSEDQEKLARKLVEETGAAYPHLLPSEDLLSILLWQVQVVPTTIFVDSEGALIGTVYTGSADYDTWAQRIDAVLEQQRKGA